MPPEPGSRAADLLFYRAEPLDGHAPGLAALPELIPIRAANVAVRRFAFDMAPLATALRDAAAPVPDDWPQQPSAFVFQQQPGRAQNRVLAISPELALFLDAWDGQRPVADLLSELGGGEALAGAARALFDEGVLVLRPAPAGSGAQGA